MAGNRAANDDGHEQDADGDVQVLRADLEAQGPNLSSAMTSEESAVPKTEPLPPVERVPPRTTAVTMSIVRSLPRSDLAVPR